MRIIALKNLEDFWKKHPNSKLPLSSWYAITKGSNWQNVNEVKLTFPKVSIVKNSRINFKAGIGFICFIGTHSEYDKINAETIWLYWCLH